MQKPVIVAALRTPIARAKKGSYAYTRIDDIAAQLIGALLKSVPELPRDKIEDMLLGCAMPEGDQGLNVARNISFLAGLPFSCGAATVNRFCASSLETISQAARAVACGDGEAFVAGGVETMTHIPMGGFNPSLNQRLMMPDAPAAYIGMGETAENLAKKFGITRVMQDEYSLNSHKKAARAQDEGLFDDEIVPIQATTKDGTEFTVRRDEGIRKDTSIEKLAALMPAFMKDGTVTAGNSSQMSDGAAAAVVMSEKLAKRLGIRPLARITGMAVAGVDPAYMGLGPVNAVPKALKRAGLKLKDIGLIELNEAFASQSLAVAGELRLNPEIVNVHGGAIALGHPLGCSGARMMATLLSAMKRYSKKRGMATMCVGGGQGAAVIVELC